MSIVVNDQLLAERLLAQRQASGGDRFDEVWDGVYMMSPLANNEHQHLATELSTAFSTVIDWKGLGQTLAGANVSDQDKNWTQNYRVPDVLVFLGSTAAENRDSHWFGGPDLAIEVISPGDRTLEKLDFYAKVGTTELLVVDRDPWQLTLYRVNQQGALVPVAINSNEQRSCIELEVVPIVLALEPAQACLSVSHRDGSSIRNIPIRIDP